MSFKENSLETNILTTPNLDKKIYNKNLNIFYSKAQMVFEKITNAKPNDDYTEIIYSKTEKPIPIFKNSTAMYSKYNPEREIESFFSESEGFFLFCGIGSGLHIKAFLEKFPKSRCAITDISYESLKCLLSLVDLSSLLADPRCVLLPCLKDKAFFASLAENYTPVLDGSLRPFMLRSWSSFYSTELPLVNAVLASVVSAFEQDLATQAQFGKVWLKNILLNLKLSEKIGQKFPAVDLGKKALVVAAGPTLDSQLDRIKKEREECVIFASGTAFLPLVENGIEPDFFVSLDPQLFSSYQVRNIPSRTVGVFDLGSCSSLARKFSEHNAILFTSSSHPLCQYAQAFASLPFAQTGHGTVFMYALDVAHRLGFTKVETVACDFCYVGGLPYAKGSYHSKEAISKASRLNPNESFFTNLMFRTTTKTLIKNGKLSYTTPLLESYAKAYESYRFEGKVWEKTSILSFPFKAFFETLIKDLSSGKKNAQIAMLPFLAYCKNKNIIFSLELVIQSILKYNSRL